MDRRDSSTPSRSAALHTPRSGVVVDDDDVTVAERESLPRQAFSSPTENPYPASTMAAVTATRARFFARQSGSNASRSTPTSRATPTGSTSEPRRRVHKGHALASASLATYRQSFFERCQRAMDQTRTAQREQTVLAFRKGAHAFTRGVLSDDMDVEDDADSTPSSPPPLPSSQADDGEREEDNEMTRRKIIAEYSRLKRIYELKGHLEIGWIHPDQLVWLEAEAKHHHDHHDHHVAEEEACDPYWDANDEELEQLWIESQNHALQSLDAGDVVMRDDEFDDAAFEEALARLPV